MAFLVVVWRVCGGWVSWLRVTSAANAEEMQLTLAGGKTLTVRAEGLSDRAKYVRRVTLNGRRVTTRALSHADLVKGGELVFEMADAPCDFAGQFQGHSK